MNRLQGKVVLITGASAGIGAECARQFAANGCKLILTARRVDRLQALADDIRVEYPKACIFVTQLDVSDRQVVMDLPRKLPQDVAQVDILVNNAGLALGRDHVEDISFEATDTMFDINVKGVLNVMKAFIPSMRQRNSGHIINVSSIAGLQAYPGGGVYCATKHAVQAISNTVRMELVATNIRVTTISPGMVETEFSIVRTGGDAAAAKRVYENMTPLSASDIAETIVFAASRPEHVQIADVIIFPSAQASIDKIHRSGVAK